MAQLGMRAVSTKGGKYLLTGAEDVDRALREFEPKLANRMVRSAMRKAGKLVAADARLNLLSNDSIDTGLLARSIKVRAWRGKAKHTGRTLTLASGRTVSIKSAQVGVQIKTEEAKKSGSKGSYGFAIEAGRHRSRPFPAKPFLRPAVYDNENHVRKMVIDDVRDQIRVTKANNIQ